jgi:hypothetical protein
MTLPTDHKVRPMTAKFTETERSELSDYGAISSESSPI